MMHSNSTPWVLLRGLGRDSRHWLEFPNLLSAAFPKSAVRTLDLPGTGTSKLGVAPFAISKTVDHLRKECADFESVNLLSISLGSMVAMHWASHFPNQVKNLVMINGSTRRLSRPWERLRVQAWSQVVKSFFTGNHLKREAAILEMTVNSSSKREIALPKFAEFASQHRIRRKNFLRQLVAAGRFRAPANISVPTLILGARMDGLVHPHCSERMANYFGAQIFFHPWAGHDLPMDDPSWVIEKIQKFFESI